MCGRICSLKLPTGAVVVNRKVVGICELEMEGQGGMGVSKKTVAGKARFEDFMLEYRVSEKARDAR